VERTVQLDPRWPYVPSRLIFWPDFSNCRNAAEGYIGFFSIPVFQKYLQLAADRMEQGLQSYRQPRCTLRRPNRSWRFARCSWPNSYSG